MAEEEQELRPEVAEVRAEGLSLLCRPAMDALASWEALKLASVAVGWECAHLQGDTCLSWALTTQMSEGY